MVNQNKIFSFKIKRQAESVFPRDVERTVVIFSLRAYINCPDPRNLAATDTRKDMLAQEESMVS